MTARQKKRYILHDAMLETLRILVCNGYASFEVDGDDRNICNCFLLLVPYCCDIVEAKYMSFVRHSFAGTCQCVRCTLNIDDIHSVQKMREPTNNVD